MLVLLLISIEITALHAAESEESLAMELTEILERIKAAHRYVNLII